MAKIFELEEQNILNGCLNNERKWQEKLYRKYAGEMFAICLAYDSDRDVAKDILQDGFIKVFRNLKNYDQKGSLKGWIRRIIVNTAIDYFRKNSRKNDFVDLDDVAEYQAETQNNENEDHYNEKDIMMHVQGLPEKARVVFNLYALEGYSHKEIAVKLDITEGTSKSQFSRARQLLQQSMKAS